MPALRRLAASPTPAVRTCPLPAVRTCGRQSSAMVTLIFRESTPQRVQCMLHRMPYSCLEGYSCSAPSEGEVLFNLDPALAGPSNCRGRCNLIRSQDLDEMNLFTLNVKTKVVGIIGPIFQHFDSAQKIFFQEKPAPFPYNLAPSSGKKICAAFQ